MGFKFRFKYLQNKSITYYATYTESGDLEISVRKHIDLEDHLGDKSKNMKVKTLNGEEAWQTFHNNCTFEDILKSVDYKVASIEEIDLNFQIEGMQKLKEPQKSQEELKVKKFIKKVSECPFILGVPEFASVFIDMLEAARWGTKKLREPLKSALRDNLIPQHSGGEKPKPQNPGLAKKLLKGLAKSLFQKLKDELEKQNLWVSKTDFLENWDSETYKLVLKWSAQKEKRLYRLNEQEWKWLIKSPAGFAVDLICTKFQISERTLERGK